jgi:hypothetical protein
MLHNITSGMKRHALECYSVDCGPTDSSATPGRIANPASISTHRGSSVRTLSFRASGTPTVLHDKLTDQGGRNLPEFPIGPIVRPTCYNFIIYNKIGQIDPISMLYYDYRADML